MTAGDAPWTEPTSQQQIEISRRYGLASEWIQLDRTGIVHTVYAVGDVVVRIPRQHPEWVADTLTESVAIPPAVQAGVKTPRLIAFVDDSSLLDVPFCIVERFQSDRHAPKEGVSQAFLSQLGREIAKLHNHVVACPDPDDWLDPQNLDDPLPYALRAELNGTVSREVARSFEAWIEKLRPMTNTVDRVFLHGDLHERNILLDKSGDFALIDWGDAGWGDAALDFGALPVPWLESVSNGYRQDRETDPGFECKVVWTQLAFAFRGLCGRTEWHEGNWETLRQLPSVSLGWSEACRPPA